MLSAINSVFDLLGFIAAVLIAGKILHSQLCLLKLGWDQKIPNELLEELKSCIKAISNKKLFQFHGALCLEELLKWSSMDSQMQINR